MTSEQFRKMALALPGASENAHMGHPDFRANGKIFATLHYPDEKWGMVKLSPEQQNNFVHRHPNVFVPVKGGWGRQGCTNVLLEAVNEDALAEALGIACANAGSLRRTAASAKGRPQGRSARSPRRPRS